MNNKIVRAYIDEYKRRFNDFQNDEIYKWEAVKQFQDNWNIEHPNFAEMLRESLSLTENLLSSNQYYPRKMLLLNAEKSSDKVRELFRNLFNEELDLLERIEEFKSGTKQLNKRNFPDTNSYQFHRAIMLYLAFKYPEKYFLY